MYIYVHIYIHVSNKKNLNMYVSTYICKHTKIYIFTTTRCCRMAKTHTKVYFKGRFIFCTHIYIYVYIRTDKYIETHIYTRHPRVNVRVFLLKRIIFLKTHRTMYLCAKNFVVVEFLCKLAIIHRATCDMAQSCA